MIALPGYVDREAWAGLLEIRARLKAPNTDYAQKLLLYELQRLKDAGHCPKACLEQSILKGWKDVYEPRDKPIQAKAGSDYDRSREYLRKLDEDRRASLARPNPLRRIS